MSKYKNNPNYYLDPVSKRWKKKDKNKAAEEYAKQVMMDAGIQEKTIDDISSQVSGGGEIPLSMVTGDGTLTTPEVSIITNEDGLDKTFEMSGMNTISDKLVIINEYSPHGNDINKEIEQVTIRKLNLGGACSVYDLYGDGDVLMRDSILNSSNIRNKGSLHMYNAEAEFLDISGSYGGYVDIRGNTVAHDVMMSYGYQSFIGLRGDNRFRGNSRGAVGDVHSVNHSDFTVGEKTHLDISKAKELDNVKVNIGYDSMAYFREFNARNSQFDFGDSSLVKIDGVEFNNCYMSLPPKSTIAIDGDKIGNATIVDCGYDNFGNGDGIVELRDDNNNKYTFPFSTKTMEMSEHNM